jgi:hypothetical protein
VSVDPPLTASAISFSATEGSAFSGIVAHFTDADPNGQVSDYTATIDWGDGTTTPGTITANSGGGFDVSGSHTYLEEGGYVVTVQIADVGGATADTRDTTTVLDAPLTGMGIPITATGGTPFSGKVAHFTDADPNGQVSDYFVTIDWGDSTTSAAAITANSGGGFDVNGAHTYADNSPHNITINILDFGGAKVTILTTENGGTTSPPPTAVGGIIIPVDMTTLFSAGAMTNLFWMVPTLGGISAAAMVLFKIKRKP